jgi:signal transduction histidine kinase
MRGGSSLSRSILLGVVGWTLLALLFAGQIQMDAEYAGRALSGMQALVLSLAGWYGWALLSPLVVAMARRLGTRTRALAAHLPIALVLSVFKIVVTAAILRRAGFAGRTVSQTVSLPLNLITYAAIVAATHGIDAYRRGREARALLAEARVDLLKSQLQPHFLFNALHSIAELMHHDVDAADRALMGVSDLLRATLEAGGRQEIRLAEELALVERYLDIERIRLGERLKITIDAKPNTLDALVPMFLLQPIVENAVRHAIAPRTSGGMLLLHASATDGELRIEVEDDGPGFPAGFPTLSPERIGLANTRARLEHLYGPAQRLETGRGASGGASVRIMFPFRIGNISGREQSWLAM